MKCTVASCARRDPGRVIFALALPLDREFPAERRPVGGPRNASGYALAESVTAVRELPCKSQSVSDFSGAHKPQCLHGHEVRAVDERLVQMEVTARYGLLLVSDQTRNCAVRQSEIGGQRCERMAQHVRRNFSRKS